MRIGYFVPGWPPGSVPNGIVTTLGHLGRVLRMMGHDVFYITSYAPPDVDDDRVFVLAASKGSSLLDALKYRWNPERAFYQASSKAIADAVGMLVEKHQLDIFQMEETQGWASLVIDKVAIPVIVRLHGPWCLNRELGMSSNEKPENRHRVERERQAIFSAAAVAAPSQDVLSATKEYYGNSTAFAAVIPNPIDTLPESERWNVDDCDPNLILFIGRFDRIKGADLVLKAFARIAQERPALRLSFVGPDIGLKNDSGIAMNFQNYVNAEIPFDVRKRIEFRGILARSEIDLLRRKAYATVVASRYETFGNVVIEAMAFGCPIVATAVGGILEIITDQRNGLLSPAEDIDGLASTLRHILNNPKLAVVLGKQAAIDCSERYDPKKIGRQTIEFYSTVIGRSKRK